MINIKLYLYDSTKPDYKGTDFSEYILLGVDYTDLINEELDTMDLTLYGLSAEYKEEFAPSTAFIFELYQDNELYRSFDIVVGTDLVSKPILSDDNFYAHNITFYEAAAIAQKRPVDNISITYKLKDVRIDTNKPNFNKDEKASKTINELTGESTGNFIASDITKPLTQYSAYNSRQFKWEFTSEQKQVWDELKYYLAMSDTVEQKDVTIPVPKLAVYNGKYKTNQFEFMGYCSVDVVIQDTDIIEGNTTAITKTIHPTKAEFDAWNNDWLLLWAYSQPIPSPKPEYHGYVMNNIAWKTGATFGPQYDSYVKKIAVAGANESETNRSVTFAAKKNHKYEVKIQLHDFANETSPFYDSSYDNGQASYYISGGVTGFLYFEAYGGVAQTVNSTILCSNISFIAYAESTPITLIHSAPPVSAYDLFLKCQLATQRVDKKPGEKIDKKKLTFYLSKEDEEQLKNTTVVENFYNQKNLWEMLIEIGKYIHSIPYIRFGEDNRYVVSWRKLGISELSESSAQPLSIFNSRNIDNYIGAVTSYVDNAVQLGGVIDEWIAPKSESEDLLVYNDVAKLFTSKNIIEILDFEVLSNDPTQWVIGSAKRSTMGEIKNLAGNGDTIFKNGFIFAKEIYNLLSIDTSSGSGSTGLAINKGLAIYYNLGTNVIEGLNYQLPAINPGAPTSEYTIKNILGTVFGIQPESWKDIKVNNYLFHIVYRTKDSMRSDQSRPDLRKYLLNSKYDEYPLHTQFNNQEDILVDTQKLGNNIYGKLIKTGNTEYTVSEWADSLYALKKSGELYNIYGNLYYVSKVKNQAFSDHVISEVTLTKDYNQLSEVIGIPSEPRFYEISEQSAIKREVSVSDFIHIGTTKPTDSVAQFLPFEMAWDWVKDLLFAIKGKSVFPKYVITTFKNDKDRLYGEVPDNELFYVDICSPLNVYSMQNTITMEWDMRDNFSAGDKVSIAEYKKSTDNSYRTLQAVRYKDVFGRSDLIDFTIMKDLKLNADEIRNLPESPIRTKVESLRLIGFEYGEPAKIVNGVVEDPAFDTALNEKIKAVGWVVNVGESLEVTTDEYDIDGNLIKSRFYISTLESNGSSTKWKSVVSKRPIETEWNNRLMSTRNLAEMDNNHGIAVMLDNREVFGGNYNVQLLTDSDRFVLSAHLWSPKTYVRFALLSEEINKISNDTISSSSIIEEIEIYEALPGGYRIDPNLIFIFKDSFQSGFLGVQINIDKILERATTDPSKAKALAFIDTGYINGQAASGSTYFVCGRNVGSLTEEQKKEKWYLSGVTKDFFKKQ